ncbi:hypothetical protein J4401_04920 [Candidatus Woesearchaeota archaeon]|nr:hypothetical protein [Candidatus Woesearchaeota archaeon]
MKYEPKIGPAGYTMLGDSAKWFEKYLAQAAENISKIERLHASGKNPQITNLLERQYLVLNEIYRVLKLDKANEHMEGFASALRNLEKYKENYDLSVLYGTSALIRSSIKAVVERANAFKELDDKVSASAGSTRVMEAVEEKLRSDRRLP